MKKNIKMGDIEIQKQKFRKYKESISIKNTGIDKIVVSNKTSFGKREFTLIWVKFLGVHFEAGGVKLHPV